MAGAGSTAWMFSKKGYITIEKNKIGEEELMELALEAGAEDFKSEGEYYEITCEPSILEAIKSVIQKKNIPMQTSEVTMIPNSTVKVQGSDAKQVLSLMEALEEHEDVQAVYANFDIPDEEIEKAAQ